MSDYQEILKTAWEDVPEVVPLPDGSWRLTLRNSAFIPPKSADKNPQFVFFYRAIEPMDDVDDDEIAELGDKYDFGANNLSYRIFYESKADLDAVRTHLAKHGVDLGKTLEEGMENAKGSEVVAMLGRRSYTDQSGEQREDNTLSSFEAVE